MTSVQYLAAALIAIGVFGVLARRNLITVLMSLEIFLNGAAVSLMDYASRDPHGEGAIIVLFVLAVAAVEVALGLALVILLFRQFRTTSVEEANTLQH